MSVLLMKIGDPTNDERLLEAYQSGDRAAFGEFYSRFRRPLYLYALSLTRNHDFAEDILQQAFFRVLRMKSREIGPSLRSLLFKITHNLVRDERRKKAVAQKHYPLLEARNPREQDELARHSEDLSAALDRLPDDRREVVVLKAFAGLTFEEIGGVLGIVKNTAAYRYQQALKQLAAWLSDES